MRTALSIIGGIAAGFALAHLVNSTPAGRRFFSGVNERVDEFTEAVAEGYRARTQDLTAAIADIK
ncbi:MULTISPECIES: Na+ dependent nucleoside transporter N-terminal domain-containing protein [Pseudoclavibacter]|uniref:Concentrative nucleoside transporter N-terminal domain-containing protein n=1 Tax=Pseudoclavibacter terrae TaxID=1530195 RepID=A0A7J5B379_9MICO|nr:MULTISPECIES: Na+ dependent nucleoside transporter N-terminal domain-containing protein [Pseudoclavibacter]KAB1638473.1 hypothetical protein F8O03_08775 [Pseudoclavibacter terrae]PPG39175.1 hypothetical protein C5C17_10150 [Pseudoclavibacter sp. RFBA6]